MLMLLFVSILCFFINLFPFIRFIIIVFAIVLSFAGLDGVIGVQIHGN
jgi:hypothetical protein